MSKDKEKDSDDDEILEFESNEEDNQLLDYESMKEDAENERPLPTSPEWHDFVMSQFTEEELLKEKNSKGELTGKEYPSIYGLRRVAELLLGEIIENRSIWKELNGGFAISECYITFDIDGTGRLFSDIGNCSIAATKPPFDAHLPSIAATRAEGRALRKALKIRTVSADEMMGGLTDFASSTSGDAANFDDGLDKPASGAQIKGIQLVCERNMLDYNKFMTYFLKDKSIENLTDENARNALSFLHSYQAGKEQLPDEIKTKKESF